MEVSGQLYATAALLPVKDPCSFLNDRLHGAQSQSTGFGKRKNFLPSRESNCDYLLVQIIPVTILTELSRFRN
jgi:hypothetical protein